MNVSDFAPSALALIVLPLALRAAPDRTRLPIPPEPYTNQIGESALTSRPQVHPPLAAPPGAPNILVVLIDDAGYGQTSTFGAPIPTPTLDRLAAGGLRYTRFHVAALCSPSRAALLTGRNHESVGMGMVTGFVTGYPGYDGEIPKSAAFISRILQGNGYATAAIGKWHLLTNPERSMSGPFDHWPTHEGFDYYYGFLGGHIDQWAPELCEGTTEVALRAPAGRADDYTLNDALADRAIAWIRGEKSATPNRPFFMYYAPGATHSPLQAPKRWIDQFRGRFDAGWDRYRETVFARQKRLGVIPPETRLTPRPPEIPAWDSLSANQRKVAARLMEVFAGYMAQTDYDIGRVIDAIEATGQLDNTLILYIAGDNGASLEGGLHGMFNMTAESNGIHQDADEMVRHLDDFGSAKSDPHYPVGWAWAGNTPFQWGKHIASHLGGTRDPLVVSWPARIKERGGIRTQFHHLVDIAPTLLEAAGLPMPTVVDGVEQMPLEGGSMVYSFNDASAPERHLTQYFEIFANRGIYHDGWIAGARSGRLPWLGSGGNDFERQPWELYDLTHDYSESRNLAAEDPAKLKSLQELFHAEALKHHAFPLDPRYADRVAGGLYDPNRRQTHFRYLAAPFHAVAQLAPPTRNRSFTIAADIVAPPGGCDGVIAADGGSLGGYSFFVEHRRLHYAYSLAGVERSELSSPAVLPAGPVRVEFRFVYDGGGLGKGGDESLWVNGRPVARGRLARTAPDSYANEEFGIGEDTGSPVGDYSSPFRFQGEIDQVTFNTAP